MIRSLDSRLRQLETEQLALHDQVRRWMRRAVAAERATERGGGPSQPAAPVGKPARLTMWGARRRIAERKALAAQLAAQDEADAEGSDNGLHP